MRRPVEPRTAVVTGATGQDGYYLVRRLLADGWTVHAAVRDVEVLNKTFFNEFTIKIAGNAAQVVERMAEKGVLGGVPVSRLLPDWGLDDLILAASTEVNTEADRAAFAEALQGALSC